jgi:hypothetical protein
MRIRQTLAAASFLMVAAGLTVLLLPVTGVGALAVTGHGLVLAGCAVLAWVIATTGRPSRVPPVLRPGLPPTVLRPGPPATVRGTGRRPAPRRLT